VGVAALVTGSGEPVTVAAHGFGASVAETRPLLGGVAGRRVFYPARGHDGAVPAPFGYRDLGDDLLRVADEYGASRALGVSMGAGALLSLLSRAPERFDRVVAFLPAALDRTRTDEAVRRLDELVTALDQEDAAEVQRLVLAEVPSALHGEPAVAAYVGSRAAFLLGAPGVAVAVRALAGPAPVEDRASLEAVSAEVLVLAQEDDPLHPVQVARELVAVLPRARLVVFDRPGVMFRERARLRALIGEFLS
jgi:3-oxoadipate enol-lactonase